MILYPAIDLKDGRCVRLLQGDMDKATVFDVEPRDQATAFQKDGFSWLHVVDLNGAVEGKSINIAAVEAILQSVSIPVQLGGGVRTMAALEQWIEAGVSRVILGTVAVRDPALVKAAAKEWPEQIAVGVDVRAGKVAVQGWTEELDLDAITVAKKFEDAGVSALIVTDIERDGALTGANVEVFGQVADGVSIPVIAAGGLATLADIVALSKRKGISGAVLGRSLYTGSIIAAEALRAAA
jgi:phosphoribosylformimino-5-aminoimidazole carboxamide ribotide isomerase